MNKKTIALIPLICAILIFSVFFSSTGCQNKTNTEVNNTIEINPETTPIEEIEINNITGKPYQDIKEKRGIITNITEFNELLRRASAIKSFKYNITDTAQPEEKQNIRFYVSGRFVKIALKEAAINEQGELFDEIFLERTTKIAFSHCGKYRCPKPNIDKEIETADYDKYYLPDPMETLSKSANPTFIKEELLGSDITKVFDITFENKPARIWLQEYYGYPLKIVIKDTPKRTIEFTDITIDNTRRGEIDLPSNFTIKGKEGSWYFWEHYLGEWPKPGTTISTPGNPVISNAPLGV